MSPFDRILLGVYTFFITIVFVLFSAVMLGWPAPLFLLKEIFYPGRPEFFWPLMAIVVLVGLRLLWVSLSGKQRGRHVVLTEGSLGQVNVSLQAIESLVEKTVSQFNGVRDVKPTIIQVQQGIGINVRIAVTPDVNLPQLSEEIQVRVKSKVLEVTGINVNIIKIMIKDISVHKPRVE
jgi:uncharacterized alkaline shock family protein YloU